MLGWIDPVLAFFIAPFFGIAWTVGAAMFIGMLVLRVPRLVRVKYEWVVTMPIVVALVSLVIANLLHERHREFGITSEMPRHAKVSARWAF